MSLNKVLLIGRLGKDPELRYTANQTAVCSLNVATNDRKKDESGNWVEHTEWHRVVVFGRVAENCGQYLQKGSQAYIEGRITTRKWQDKDGQDRYTTEIIANNVQFLGARGEGATVEKTFSSGGGAVNAAPAQSQNFPQPGPESVPFDDDDIPF